MKLPFLSGTKAKHKTQTIKLNLECLEERVVPSGVIEGILWNDTDGNGVQDAGELPLASKMVYLDANGNGAFDAGEQSQTTGVDGSYRFTGLAAGPYQVKEVLASGWVETSPRDATLTSGSAAPAVWQSSGLVGGDAVATAVSPLNSNLVFAALASDTYHGALYRSSDGGASWVELPAFLETPVLDVAVAADGTVYAGNYQGLWRSTDNGVTFSAVDMRLTYDTVLVITTHPTDANTIYVGLNPGFGQQPFTIWKTTDAGATWSNVTPSFASDMAPTQIALDPADPNKVYATYGGSLAPGGIFYSPNGGASWFDRRSGLPFGAAVWDVAFTGTSVLVAGGLGFGSQSFGLYRSTDNGATWTALSNSWTKKFARTVVVDPNNSSIITVGTESDGIYRSTNGGSTWTFDVPGVIDVRVNDLVYSGNGLVAAVLTFAVLRSSDGGASFSASANGIIEFDLTSAAVNPNDPNEIAAAYGKQGTGGIITSTDGGRTWQTEPVPASNWSYVTFAPDGRLYAISQGSSAAGWMEGLSRRNTDGSWTSLGPSYQTYFDTDLQTVAFSETDPNVLIVAGQVSGFVPAAEERQRPAIWRSADGGATWTRVWIGTDWAAVVTDVEVLAGEAVMLATVYDSANQVPQNSTVLRSTDGGLTWVESTAGLPANVQAIALAASATDPNKVYLSNYYGYQSGAVYVSNNAGLSWTATVISQDIFGTAGIVVDPSNDQIIYVQGGVGPIARSTDGGATFSLFDQGLNFTYGLMYGEPALSIAGGSAPRLVAATRSGVFVAELYSTDTTARAITLGEDETVSNVNFGSRPLGGEIKGTVFEDENSDGIWQPQAEFARSGWTVYLDTNGNSILDPGEQSYRTSGGGEYRFTGLEAGSYTIRLQGQTGYRQTGPASNGGYAVNVTAGGTISAKNFGFESLPTEIRGTKWKDDDGDGVFDANESPVSGWTMFLDQNANGALDAGEQTAVTDSLGRYVFTGLQPGTYLVGEVQQANWQQTSPGDGHSQYDAGLGYDSAHGIWRDHDTSTPAVIDIWYDFRSRNGYTNLITAAQITAAESAMRQWELATGGKIKFTQNTTAALSDIINIGTGDLAAIGDTSVAGGTLGRGGAGPDGSGGLTSGVAWMDMAENWDTTIGNGNPPGTVDYFSIAMHEIGHAIGMEHTGTLPWAVVMGTTYSSEYTALSAVDVDQVRRAYGSATVGSGFFVVQVDRGETRTGIDFGSKQLTVPFNELSLDFGTDTSPVQSGYVRATATTTYTTASGYGWTSGTRTSVDRGTSNSLTRDFVSTADATFVVNVPNGTYQVTVTLGDASSKRDKMTVSLEGTQVANVSTNSGQFSTQTFNVTVVDGQMTIRFRDLGGKSAELALNALRIVRVLPTLTVTTNTSSVSEGAGANAATGTVTRTGDLSQPLTVTLMSSDTSEASVPLTVTIPAGQASVVFWIAAVDDPFVDGPQTVTITASASGYMSGSRNLSVLDND